MIATEVKAWILALVGVMPNLAAGEGRGGGGGREGDLYCEVKGL